MASAHKKRVAIYSGKYPDSTFINSLMELLTETGEFEIWLFGTKAKGVQVPKEFKHQFRTKSKLLNVALIAWAILALLLRGEKKVLAFVNHCRRQYDNYDQIIRVLCDSLFVWKARIEVLHLNWILHYQDFEYFLDFNKDVQLISSVRGTHFTMRGAVNNEAQDIIQKSFSRSRAIHCVSEYFARVAQSDYKDIEGKLRVITPGVDISLFNARKGAPQNKIPFLVTVARLHWIKGHAYTLRALYELKNEGFDFRYEMIGSGTQHEELTFLIDFYGLAEQVKLRGKLAQKDLVKIMHSADAFVLSSVEEGFCNAALEAQAIGLPCIVSNAGGLAENVADGTTGFHFESRSVESLKNTIKKFVDLPHQERQVMGVKGIDRVKSDFNLTDKVEEFRTLYAKS